MRRSRSPVPAVVLAALVAGGCAAHRPDVYGRTVTLVPSASGAPKVEGELLAADEGKLWLRTRDGVREFDAAALREVRVRQHDLTGGWAVRWGLVGGLVSGVALAASCSSVEGTDSGGCARVGVSSAALWALVGFLAAPSLEASSQLSLDPGSDRLKPYARLPAGLPKDLPPAALEPGPPAPE
jgi:hypothetical protein